MAVTHNWSIQQIDINNAFLNGTLSETVFMAQPEGFIDSSQPTAVCKLNKSLYGLKQAPRAWFTTLKQFLTTIGFQVSVSDSSLFHKRENGKLLLILVYVDDILLTGDDSHAITSVIQQLNQKFALKTLGEVNYFLGLEARRTSAGLFLSQTKYTHDLLAKTGMLNSKPTTVPLCPSHKLRLDDSPLFDQPTLYRSTIGALQYLTKKNFEDISFAVNKLSQFLHAPTTNHWIACKHLLRFLKGTLTLGLVFKPVQRFLLEGYSDADWASSLDDRRSTGGYVFTIGGGAVSWKSSKQTCIARSTMESEFIALDKAGEEAEWLHNFLEDIPCWPKPVAAIMIHCDSQSAIGRAQNSMYNGKSRHIHRRHNTVRQLISNGVITIDYVKSKENLADPLTKGFNRDQVYCLSKGMGLKSTK
ncbi:hypothetical protein DH2020_041316 [Rehmannia glutinosa]|uniref:Reverse transcriptase Ty1/copia-type domain-containing protein n=1 Tax=Rehmannia glutinosa TaxID=99300 RepID=A0ABR0UR68_REHGL